MILAFSPLALLGGLALSYEVPEMELTQAFAKFKEDYGIDYPTPQETALREEIFIENYRHIQRVNAEGRPYKLAINKFADQSSEEFAAAMLTRGYRKRYRDFFGAAKRPGFLGVHHYSGKPLPDEIDWSHLNAVTRVKNQGSCGSCWAFSATGSLEGRYEIANPKHDLVEFSEQQLVDCSTEEGNMGCNGGLMDYAFKYVIEHGLCTEEDYGYDAVDEPCRNSTVKKKARLHPHDVVGYVDVDSKNGAAMKEALQTGPVSVAIEADMPDFQFYHEGVLTGECGDSLDHGVLLVGYGEMDGTKYWKVKNSWGAEWGKEGYILLERERADGTDEDECGILLQGSYPKFREDINKKTTSVAQSLEVVIPEDLTLSTLIRPPSNAGHYHAPPCDEGDAQAQIKLHDHTYELCSPPCGPDNSCPPKPAGVDAREMCVLSTHPPKADHCALICMADGDLKCPEGMTCVPAQGQFGVCLSEVGVSALPRVKGTEVIYE
ncbi:hypothetical protein FOZ60_016211 [Perkinsus olseni]|uniref:Uncharacterized protein n=2 Tax=Perkinsus olseni TaxID=32597 RepID=A0A7J6P4S7_PEROL|nr:hypothetical protein FOZ60_016211 [Perkinsus olseni]